MGSIATGKAVSKEFTIKKPLITFLIGGGNHPGQTCFNLVVNSRTVRTQTGNGSADLSPALWNVGDLMGQRGHLEVVDNSQSADRGYVMIDDIRFEDDLTVLGNQPAMWQEGVETHAPTSAVEKLMAARFVLLGNALKVGESELANPIIADHGSWMSVRSGNWCLSIDCSGGTSFRPATNLPVLLRTLTERPTSRSRPSVRDLVDAAKRIAASFDYGSGATLESRVRREEIFVGRCGGEIQVFDGDYLVRLWTNNSREYMQVMLHSDGTPFRLDTSVRSRATDEIANYLLGRLKRGVEVTPVPDDAPEAAIVSYISIKEPRFAETAESYEGVPWLRSQDGMIGGPNVPEGAHRMASLDLWDHAGRVGGLRGDYTGDSWAKQRIRVSRVPMISFRPTAGRKAGSTLRMDSSFYSSVESNTIAIFCTHGGPINGEFQLDLGVVEQGNGLDCWFALGSSSNRFGTGELRHLLLQSCGGLSYYSEKELANRVLTKQWMAASCVRGLRTICGYDGNGSCDSRCGTLFAGQYNKGDSIYLSWLLASMNENNGQELWPVTLAYGGSLPEAARNLVDGRFSTLRIECVIAFKPNTDSHGNRSAIRI